MVEKSDNGFFRKELMIQLVGPVLAVMAMLVLGGGYIERLETLEEGSKNKTEIVKQIRKEAVAIVEKLTEDFIERDRRIWDVVRAQEKAAAKDREAIASLRASLGHLAGQLNRIESKIDRVIEQRAPSNGSVNGHRERSGG